MKDKLPKRKHNRLIDYDYSNTGYYFITICVDNKQDYLGVIKDETLFLNEFGKTVEEIWKGLKQRFTNIDLDEYIVMPNHFHGILVIDSESIYKKNNLSSIVGAFKSLTTIKIHKMGLEDFKWQRSFFDRIIRNEKELYHIRKYIVQNPLLWDIEKNNPDNINF